MKKYRLESNPVDSLGAETSLARGLYLTVCSQRRKVIGQRQGCRIVVKGYGKAQDPYGQQCIYGHR